MLQEKVGMAAEIPELQRDRPVFDVDAVIESLSLRDVTTDPNGLSVAFDIAAEGYSALSSATLSPREVREEVCNDLYHRSGIARTLLLTGLNPQTARIEPLGTVRITLGSDRTEELGLPPLEAMGLMAPDTGWENFHFQGFDVDHVVEGGRIAVARACRTEQAKRAGVVNLLIRALVEGGYRIAASRFGKSQYWGILPHYVVTRFRAAGIGVIPAPGVSLRLLGNAQLFHRYDHYWLRSNPCFCKVIVAAPSQDKQPDSIHHDSE
jgi:hypothetical protein